jgi:hypothetical protein
MKLTKSIIAAVALATFALPTTAQAQINPSDVVGHLDSVSGEVIIQRAGQYLRAQNMSAIMAGDTVFAKTGSAMARLNGCNGKFTPCDQLVTTGNKVALGNGNFCSNLASVLPIGAGDAVLTAGQAVGAVPTIPGGISTGGGILGTAPAISPALLAIAGAGVAFGAFQILDGDDDDDNNVDVPTSP